MCIKRNNGKKLSEFDMDFAHEKITHDMVMFLTDGRRGGKRFRDEFTANFGKATNVSRGGYTGNVKLPRIRIAGNVLYNPRPRMYTESTNINKRAKIGQFYGEPEYITRAVIAHNLVHAVIETPYLSIKPKWRSCSDGQPLHGNQWRLLYGVLREKYINPYVEHIDYDWKKQRAEIAAGAVPFTADLTKNRQQNIAAAKARFNIKGEEKKLICIGCLDEYIPKECDHGDHMNDDGYCMDCHVEMNHQSIGSPEENTSLCCGNDVGYPEDDAIYFPGICDRFYYGV